MEQQQQQQQQLLSGGGKSCKGKGKRSRLLPK
jgi:hypothetical protein